jgi:hypothetical protein
LATGIDKAPLTESEQDLLPFSTVRALTFSVLAIGWLLGLSAFEIYHFVQGAPWPGYTPVVNYISFFYVALFLIGCLQLARYQFRRPVLPIIAFLGSFIHGAVIRVGGGWQGYVHMFSGAVLLMLGFASLKYQAARKPKAARRLKEQRAA